MALALRRHVLEEEETGFPRDRKSTRLNSSHSQISYAVFCLKKKKKSPYRTTIPENQKMTTASDCMIILYGNLIIMTEYSTMILVIASRWCTVVRAMHVLSRS